MRDRYRVSGWDHSRSPSRVFACNREIQWFTSKGEAAANLERPHQPTAPPRLRGPAFWLCLIVAKPNTYDSFRLGAARVGRIDEWQ
jgi:hypothetical protein